MAGLTAKCEEPASCNIAYAYVFRLEKALQHKDGELAELISQPMFAPLHEDPRWLPFLRK